MPIRIGPGCSRLWVPCQVNRPLLSKVKGPFIVPFAQSYSTDAERPLTSILICWPPQTPLAKRCGLRGRDTPDETASTTRVTIAKSLFRFRQTIKEKPSGHGPDC